MTQDPLPILPYPDRRAGRSSGWSGSDTSRERAEHDDAAGVTSRRQRYVLDVLDRFGRQGLTWRELADLSGMHHGQASGVLSNLHAAGLVARLAERRDRSHPYVLPDHVDGRATQRFKTKGPRPTLATAWAQGFEEGLRDDDAPVPDNPYGAP